MKGLVDSSPSSKPRRTGSQSRPAKTPSSGRGAIKRVVDAPPPTEGVVARRSVTEEQVDEAKRNLVVNALLKGGTRGDVAHQAGLSEAQVFRIEEEYYTGQAMLSEHARLMKQLARLDRILGMLDARVQSALLANPDADPKYFEALLKAIDQVSDLMGLKKTRIQTEVRVIEERQVNIIVAFTRSVVEAMEAHLRPMLTMAGREQLEAKREEWLAQATQASAEILEATAPMEL
nr:MAG TPA: hypothetical protein [Caudoviricetes sp.]